MIHLTGVVFNGGWGDDIAVDCTSINGAVYGAVVVSDNSGI